MTSHPQNVHGVMLSVLLYQHFEALTVHVLQVQAVSCSKLMSLSTLHHHLNPDHHCCMKLVSHVSCICVLCVCRCDLANRRDALCATLHQSGSPPDHGDHSTALNAVTRVVHCRA